ncbi:MAG: hypothetical protein K6V36_10395 [Anaerolineae bacterium]|nr:hypothetical protein [Anaerolineae bacterium]
MDVQLKTVIRQFGMSRGQPVSRPRQITVVDASAAPGARPSRGDLYILLEVLGGFPDAGFVLSQLAGIITEEYYRGTGSTTGSIGAALRAANEWLFEENLNSPREQRGVAGATCAVLRDGQLYLGQIGPALAYLWQADTLRRFPEDSPWLRQAIPSDTERAASPPLGVRRVVEPQFRHAALEPGDAFVLASPVLARLAPGEMIADIIALGPDVATRELQRLAGEHDLNVLVIGVQAEGVLVPWPGAEEAPEEAVEVPEPRRPRRARRAGVLPIQSALGAMRQLLQRAGHSVGTLAGNLLSERRGTARPVRQPARRPSAPQRGRFDARLIAVVAILVPVLVLAIALITRHQYESSRRAQIAGLLRQASDARASIVTMGQRDQQRQTLLQAISLIDQALQLDPQEPAALQMRRSIMDELDATSVIQRLYTMWELADLADATGTARLSRVIVRGPDVFILDTGADRVFHRLLTPAGDALEAPAPAPLVQKGQTYGGVAVGELVDLVWMPSGGERSRSNLLILERGGSLLEWDPQRGITVLPVADSAAWRKPQAAGAFSGNFYLLDPQQDRILKYVAAAGGYTNPPLDYLTEPSPGLLTGAIDMAIDGNIYVLLADGTILKFYAGKQQVFRTSGLDEPLRNPVALYCSGEDDTRGYLYVADAGLARVVQFTKQGEFVRQFRAPEGQMQLTQLGGLFVDETLQRMYLTCGTRLYMAPLSQGQPSLGGS